MVASSCNIVLVYVITDIAEWILWVNKIKSKIKQNKIKLYNLSTSADLKNPVLTFSIS